MSEGFGSHTGKRGEDVSDRLGGEGRGEERVSEVMGLERSMCVKD